MFIFEEREQQHSVRIAVSVRYILAIDKAVSCSGQVQSRTDKHMHKNFSTFHRQKFLYSRNVSNMVESRFKN